MAVTIAGRQFWLWRAVDDEGEVLDLLVQRRRDKAGAVKLLRKLLKKQGFAPDVLVTDKLRSYGVRGEPPPRPESELGFPIFARPNSVRVTAPLNAIATPAAREPGPLVTRWRSLKVAKVDSTGLVVRRWIQRSAG